MPEAAIAAPAAAPVAPAVGTPPPNGAPPKVEAKPTAPAEDFLEYVVDGKTVRETRAEALKKLSKSGYADQLIKQGREALKAQRAREAEIAEDARLLEQDEEAYLVKKGRDPKAFARRMLEKELRLAEMTPDQRAAMTSEERAAKAEKEAKELREAHEARQVAEQTTRIQQHLENDLATAAKAVGYPTDPKAFAVLYELVQDHFDAGLPVDAGWGARIVDAAKAHIDGVRRDLARQHAAGLKGQALADWLGPEVVKDLMATEVQRIRGRRVAPPAAPAVPAVTKPNHYLTPAEASAQLRALRGSR